MKLWPRSRSREHRDSRFKDPRSRVLWRTGRVILKGQDKTDLRRKVYQRAQGRCEIEWSGKRCNRRAPWDGIGHGELVHITASAHGGSDSEANTLWGCRDCHKRKFHPGPQFAAERRRREAAGENPQGAGEPVHGVHGGL